MRKSLKQTALSVGQRAVEHLLADEQRAMKVAAALGRLQHGKRALEKRQEELMRALQLATRSDLKGMGKQLSGLKRRTRELEERLEALASKGAAKEQS